MIAAYYYIRFKTMGTVLIFVASLLLMECSNLHLDLNCDCIIRCNTRAELLNMSLNAKTKTRGLLEIISNASELEMLPIREKEESLLKQFATKLTHKLPEGARLHEAKSKTFILLQCHLSRLQLSAKLQHDRGT